MSRFAIQRVTATPAALQLIERLIEKHGPVAFLQSGDCSDWTPAMCLTKAELLPSPSDVKLGEIGGSPFYVDRERYDRSDRPVLVIDVAEGPAGDFSLEGLEELHFVTRSPYEAAVTD
ncbi:MAG: DUF779 domain-containing protein [Solirubrobacterales bacterium]